MGGGQGWKIAKIYFFSGPLFRKAEIFRDPLSQRKKIDCLKAPFPSMHTKLAIFTHCNVEQVSICCHFALDPALLLILKVVF